ncbi:MAG: type II toxin-antitoxin system VapC family toxin [Chitinophagaceae bacterium]|nr:type II toxin-antitoxin system VapC family toxin [Rubrivivax sp.]
MSAPALFVAEPRALWAQRAPVVVDCSVFAALLFDEPAADAAARRLEGRALHAPSLVRYELTSVARHKQRRGLPLADALAALTDFDLQRVQLHSPTPTAVLTLAAQHSLSAYDAAYLWLAAELNAPLATFDRQLADAAQKHLGRPPHD